MNLGISKFNLSLLFVLVSIISPNIFAQLSLENIWNSREFSPKFVNGLRSLNDGVSYCQLDKNADNSFSCNKYDIKTGAKLSNLFNSATIETEDENGKKAPLVIASYEFSTDEKKVLISNGFEAVYRHSGKSNVYIHDLNSKKTIKLSKDKVMYATFSPNGEKVAYVKDNNLFYFDLSKNKEIQVTKDGIRNQIINGAVDWVYEEEFSMSKGFEWSPNSQYLAYYKFDETLVPEFSMDIYGSLYPQKEVWKYPKAGEKNSVVDVYIHKLGSKRDLRCETGSENDQYLPRIKWMSPHYLSVQRLNRHQNNLEVLKFSYQLGKPQIIYQEKNEKYIEVNDLYFRNEEGKQWVSNQMYYLSEKKGYVHLWTRKIITKYDVKGKAKDSIVDIQLTDGNWDIDQYLGVDEKNNKAFFTSGMKEVSERQLFSIDLNTKNIEQITKESGWHTIQFTETFDYFVDQYSTMTSPPVTLIKSADGITVRVMETNQALKQKLDNLNLGSVTFGQFTSSEQVKLDYWQITPSNFDSSKKYPVLFFVYGGPGYQTVKNQWGGPNYLWYQYLANQGYIVISVDNRGSGGRGEAFKKVTYLNLGKYETIDYIEAAKYFGSQAHIDAKRIGIFGWSYGGFMASNCITLGADYFKAAIAVAPVTNWRFYDNIYTERYMRTPNENADGYDKNSPINHVDKIKGNYLIIHGTADDNVHFQNAAEMVKAMNEKNIPYDAEYYPNTNHSIRGGKIRWHLFNKMTEFILEKL
jgi:dipeptidyl-peptidase-4